MWLMLTFSFCTFCTFSYTESEWLLYYNRSSWRDHQSFIISLLWIKCLVRAHLVKHWLIALFRCHIPSNYKQNYICGLAAWKEKVRLHGLLVSIGTSIEYASHLRSFPSPPSVSSYIIKKMKITRIKTHSQRGFFLVIPLSLV